MAERIGDGVLAIFSALAYTVVWEQTAANSFVSGTTITQEVLEYPGSVIFFLMIFPATRCIYHIEELLTNLTSSSRLQSVFLLLVTMIFALLAIPRGM